ncbi:MAG: allophanate hydrolase, partial [Betaproteobacteria bacterium]
METNAVSMTISALLADYRSGKRTPSGVVESLLQQPDDPAYACTWIQRVDADTLRRRARALEDLVRNDPQAIERLPLYGVPYAVKDNIDVAGLPTTAACPAFSYVAPRSATVVEKLEAAGAMLVGKTNMDQFATGLVGTRSPYGPVPNSFLPAYISGGSSSGSAVSVARGQVSFSLGTDTAGSGRVPAGLNNLVGLKPTRGLISARGVVPACQSLDCVSIFALTVPDAIAVLDVASGYDGEDPYSRAAVPSSASCGASFRFAVPSRLEFYGDAQAEAAFTKAVGVLEALGGQRSEIDFTVFLDIAALLYEGPSVAERMAAIRPFFEKHAEEMHPVVRQIIGGASRYDATDTFTAMTRLQALRKTALAVLKTSDVLIVPTAPTAYTIAEVLADPIATNRRMGYYTNAVNLLDLA